MGNAQSFPHLRVQKAMHCLKHIKYWKLFRCNSLYFEKLRLCANIQIRIMIGLIEIHSQMEDLKGFLFSGTIFTLILEMSFFLNFQLQTYTCM